MIAAVLSILLAGCGVNAAQWDSAQKACASNGGVSHVAGTIFQSTRAWCNNGAMFDVKEDA